MRDLVDELLQAKVKATLFGGDHAPRLGRLVILDRLGSGAMGTVFTAYDPQLDRKVAVKLLRPDAGGDAVRVIREARALGKLAHPNVVAVHDVGELDGEVYIVMEHASTAADDRTDRSARTEAEPKVRATAGVDASNGRRSDSDAKAQATRSSGNVIGRSAVQRPARAVRSAPPGWLHALVVRALADPLKRFPSMDALAAALGRDRS